MASTQFLHGSYTNTHQIQGKRGQQLLKTLSFTWQVIASVHCVLNLSCLLLLISVCFAFNKMKTRIWTFLLQSVSFLSLSNAAIRPPPTSGCSNLIKNYGCHCPNSNGRVMLYRPNVQACLMTNFWILPMDSLSRLFFLFQTCPRIWTRLTW